MGIEGPQFEEIVRAMIGIVKSGFTSLPKTRAIALKKAMIGLLQSASVKSAGQERQNHSNLAALFVAISIGLLHRLPVPLDLRLPNRARLRSVAPATTGQACRASRRAA